jgi:hypothetical protein
MIFLIVIVVIFAYSPTAVWISERGGVRRLWVVFSIAFSLIILLALAVSAIYSVPSTARLVLFVIAFGGSTLLCSTVVVHITHAFQLGQSTRALAAMGSAMVGALVGMVLVVYGLRSW